MEAEDIAALAAQMSMLTNDYRRVVEPAVSAPQYDRDFQVDPVNILPRSRETQGIRRNRRQVTVEPYQLPEMPEREPGVYYTPSFNAQFPSQMSATYEYPYSQHPPSHPPEASHDAGAWSTPDDQWIQQNIFGDSPDIEPSQAPHPEYNLGDDITQLNTWVGGDLQGQFDAEASAARQRRRIRRNPDRDARRRPRDCGTSSGHRH